MAGNFRAGAGVETPSQGRTAVQGSYVPVRQAPVQQVPAGYELVYRMGGPRYMYGETPLYGARYADGGIVPGQIYGNMRGSREGADMFGFFPTMFQSQPYATASQMYTPSLGVMPLIGYPSKYPHVIMGGYTDYGAPIANQAMNMMLPLLMMGLYRQMFPMMPQAPAQAVRAAGGGGNSGGGSAQRQNPSSPVNQKMAPRPVENENDSTEYSAVDGYIVGKNPGNLNIVSDATDDMKKVYDPAASSRTSDDMQARVQADMERVRRERAEQEARDAALPWYTRAANTFNKYAGLGPWAGGLRLAGDTIDYLYTR